MLLSLRLRYLAFVCSFVLSACDSSGHGSIDIGDEEDGGDAGSTEVDEDAGDDDEGGMTIADDAEVSPPLDAEGPPMMDAMDMQRSDAGDVDADAQQPEAGPPPPAWTILVYMAADNNLEKFAIDDLNEMLAADLTGDINLLVQMDRASGFYELGVGGVANWTTMKRFKVGKNKLTEVGDLGEQDTGEPDVLSDFIKWGFTTYPSQHRLLVLWNHGNAWQGYGGDDTSDHDLLDQAELDQAITGGLAGAKLDKVDLIGLDACLMSTFVNAQAMEAHTRYYIASEEFEPGNGWDYTASLNYLASKVDTSIVDLGTNIVNGFYAQCRKEKKHADATINLIDLGQIGALKQDFDDLIEGLDQSLDDRKTRVAGARTKAAAFGYHADPEHDYQMVDLGDLTRRLASQDKDLEPIRDKMLSTLRKLVVASKYGANKQDSSGVTVYFPTAQAFYKNGYDAVQEGAPWRELLKKFYNLSKTTQAAAPAFQGQSVAGSGSSSRPRYRAPGSGAGSLTSDPVSAAPTCVASEGPKVSSPLNAGDIAKVASSTLVSGLVDSRSGEVHVFSREPATLDANTGNVSGTWDRHVLVANQGAQQALLFAEVKISADQRFAFASVPMLYSEPPECRCASPGTPGFSDVDADGRADCADGDVDGDGVDDKGTLARDNCPWIPNRNQADVDADGVGDACASGSGAPVLGCSPEPSGDYAKLESAFWQVTVDRLNGEKYAAALYVSTATGASEISPLPGALLWPRGLVLKGDGSLVFETGQPLSFNLQQPIEFNYLDIEQIFVLNEAGDTLLDAALQSTRLMDKLGWDNVFMRVFVSDFAGRGGAAEVEADFSACDPPEPEFCAAPKVPDCDGRCLDPVSLLANGTCDDGAAGKPNLNCELRNFDDGECVRPDCEGGYIRDCEGKCTLKAAVLGDGSCDALARCESLEFDHGDCPCGPDCSGHGTCGAASCACADGYTGAYCQTPPTCGNGSCALADGETCSTCAADCGACATPCGDGACSPNQGESCETCAADCGTCACGDGHCGGGEDCSSCAKDCGDCPLCGDFVCQSFSATAHYTRAQSENCAVCATDCGACTGDCCVASQGTSDKLVGGGCGDATVSRCVCSAKPECCANGWTAECVEYAKNSCALTCDPCPPALGGDVDGDARCGRSDNCPLAANANQADEDQDGVGDACDLCGVGDDKLDPDQDLRPSACDNCSNLANPAQTDADGDARGDVCDNCPAISNGGQQDADGDRVGNVCDNCAALSNPDQRDVDGDGIGDACDPCNDAIASPDTDHDGVQDSCDSDDDADGIPDTSDNCALIANAGQADLDQDGTGDVCDADRDGDTVPDVSDNCPLLSNIAQADLDVDGQGDACDGDRDGDGVADAGDNCPLLNNAAQNDLDQDGQGDACDSDDDGDSVADVTDNCPLLSNAGQTDLDVDGIGDACDTDRDGDGVLDGSDNCPLNANAVQSDTDQDGQGDVCDSDDDADGVADVSDNCPLVGNAGQSDIDLDGQGDVCDGDRDGDGVLDGSDNCPLNANAGQADQDLDGLGDACDSDRDGDGVAAGLDSDDGNRFVCHDADLDTCDDCVSGTSAPAADGPDADGDGACNAGDLDRDGDAFDNLSDNCPDLANPGQADVDGDNIGDACDPDIDGDSMPNGADNCPSVANNAQENFDQDAQGDACDTDDDNDGTLDPQDQCPFDPARITAGQCGCLGIDTDSDGDGTADCIDACPNTANSIAKPCNCGPNLQDNDGDGICQPDCEGAGLGNCNAHGTCNDQTGFPFCQCAPGYTGITCNACAAGFQDNDLNGTCVPDCASSGLTCGGNGTCSDASGLPSCSCNVGFGGPDCTLFVSNTQMKGGSASDERPWGGVVSDAAGNSYVFTSFGGGPTNFGDGTPITSYGSSDSVLVSYDNVGNTRWVRQIGGVDREDTGRVSIDGAGNLFVVGTTYSTLVHVDASQTVPAPGSFHAYVASYSSTGTFRWAKVLAAGEGYSIATDPAGNVFVGGWVSSGGFDYGSGAGVQQARGAGDMFLVSYSGDGATTRWANVYGSDQPSNGVRDLAADGAGNVYMAAYIGGPNGDVGGQILAHAGGGNANAVLASYTNNGAHRWSRSFVPAGGGLMSQGRVVAADAFGQVAFGVLFTDTIDLGGGPVTTSSSGSAASALGLFDAASGTFLIQRNFLTGVPFDIYEAVFDPAGNVYVAGNQNNGGGDLGAGTTRSGAFVASYDGYLDYRFGQIAGGGAYPIATGLSLLPSGDLLLVGDTNTSIDWGTGTKSTSGLYDFWLTRLNPLPILYGLGAHFSARDVTSVTKDGSNFVSSWDDTSGNAHPLSVAFNPPVFGAATIGSHPVLDFANGGGMNSNAFPMSSEMTVFAVFKYGNPANWGAIIHHGHRDNDWSMEQNAFASPATMHFQSANDNAGADLTFQFGSAYIAVGRMSNGVREFMQVSQAGTNATSANGVTVNQEVFGSMFVGTSDAGESSNAAIGEIIYYDRPLSDPERDAVISYLRGEWGI